MDAVPIAHAHPSLQPGREPYAADGPSGGVPGKNPRTERPAGGDHAAFEVTLRSARADLDAARDRHLPSLGAAIADRSYGDAAVAASLLRLAMSRTDANLAYLSRASGARPDQGAGVAADLAKVHDDLAAVRAAAATLLPMAPRPKVGMSTSQRFGGFVANQDDVSGLEEAVAADLAEQSAWRARLDASSPTPLAGPSTDSDPPAAASSHLEPQPSAAPDPQGSIVSDEARESPTTDRTETPGDNQHHFEFAPRPHIDRDSSTALEGLRPPMSAALSPTRTRENRARASSAPSAVIATPESSVIRVGDRYAQSFKGRRRGRWRVDETSDLIAIRTHNVSASGTSWKGSVEGVAPGIAAIQANNGTAASVSVVTVRYPKPEIRTTRIHAPAQFEDPVATTLYPMDWIQVRATLDVGKNATFSGEVSDADGLLKPVSSAFDGSTLTAWAVAQREGRAAPYLELRANHRKPGFMHQLHRVDIVPSLAESKTHMPNVEKEAHRVKTKDLHAAVQILAEAINGLLHERKVAIREARTDLSARKAPQPISWWTNLLLIGLDAAISFFTAGVGNRLGRALSRRASVERDLGNMFDLESAFGSFFKDGLKASAKAALTARAPRENTKIAESAALDIFCDAQLDDYSEESHTSRVMIWNQFDTLKEIEQQRPGAGLAAIEARRHALAAEYRPAKEDAYIATILEWIKIVAMSSHGAEPLRDRDGGVVKDAAGEAVVGSNLGNGGRGHIELGVYVDMDNPMAPARPSTMSIVGLNQQSSVRLHERGGRLVDLGLPYQVSIPRRFILGRNEVGDIWITLITGAMGIDAGWSKSTKRYLLAKATDGGSGDGLSTNQMEVGIHAGARRILDEVGAVDIRDIALQTPTLGWESL